MTEKEKEHSDSDESGSDQYPDSDLNKDYSGRASPCFITVETEDGGVEHIQINPNEADSFSPVHTGAFFNPSVEVPIEEDESQVTADIKAKRSNSIKKEQKRLARRRIVSKHGDCNVQLYRVSKKRRQFIKDVFTTCVDMQWRYTLLAFIASFFLSWLAFAAIWYLICWAHGDFEEDHLPDKQGESGWTPCVLATYDFTSAFLFSVETQHTIGYGSRQTTEKCPEAVILQCIQSVAGVIIQACMAGIVFAKLARPKQRSNTLMFSKNAVITVRNGFLYLLFRVGNLRSSHLLEAHARAIFVHKAYTKEGESIHFHQEELQIGSQLDGEGDKSFLIWPATYGHKIDKKSPLWKLGPREILNSKFEIIVTLEGIVEPTGNSVQARSSYMPNEILWGHRFENMVSYAKHKGVYAVDMSSMNQVAKDNSTPRCSAKQMNDLKSFKGSSTRLRSTSTINTTGQMGLMNGIPPSNKKYSLISLPGHRVSRFSTVVSPQYRGTNVVYQEEAENRDSISTQVTRLNEDNNTHTNAAMTDDIVNEGQNGRAVNPCSTTLNDMEHQKTS